MKQYRKEVLSRLERMERDLDRLCKELTRQVPGAAQETPHEREPDEWVQRGIDNIMAFQAGRKREADGQ